jgi:tetratricopeptide (TPR) repeat protein
MQKVKVWQEKVILPTYETGKPEKNPVFIEKRVYQGSSGSVYPYPVIEKIEDVKTDKEYQAVYLENDFVKIMILPELGGRVHMAYDKTKERHFVYYNQVIKPALVGLTGPWISGGIEFNWPQHHRPSTFDAIDFTIEKHADGSATVWCSEVERMFRTKGMAGFTLHPDKSYLEIRAKLYNRTPFPQTFLWWANPAVKVNDDYQSVFPPDVNAVFDHGKRDVSSFPIAKGTYYKVDYSPGTDISRYKNIPVPTSYMAITSKYNFVGGYENDSKGGLLHVANHHVSPGKKQWTWGNGDFGRAWDRNLTDEDGPYIELMCGVYTDNQPDFSWLMPGEQKDFVQYFMPYRDLGIVKNATQDAMVNLEKVDGKLVVKVYTTGVYPNTIITVKNGDIIILKKEYDASPTVSYEKEIEYANDDLEGLSIAVTDANGKVLVDWNYEGPNEAEIPEPAKPALQPEEIDNNEQLFLTALHLEQYRHATYSPVPYYQEALRRDPGDVRCNNAMGLWLMRKAKFIEAEPYFRAAIKTLTQRNPNPYDGEPYFNLGVCLKYVGKYNEAYDAFYKSTWNAAWQNQAYFYIAQLDALKGDFEQALMHVNKSIAKNTQDHKALHLKLILLRKLGQEKKALQLGEEYLAEDHFNYGALYEKYLLTNSEADLKCLNTLIRGNIHNYIEYAQDYASAGFYNEAINLLKSGIDHGRSDYPIAWYYLGWFYEKAGNRDKAAEFYKRGSKANPDYCFPNQVEAVQALNAAVENNPVDSKAYYYLGNFWYGARQYSEAIAAWETSLKANGTFPTVQRNLALAYFNKQDRKQEALALLEKAFALDPTDARILMELDQLYKRFNKYLIYRLAFLERHLELVIQRDDIYLERIALYNLLGKYDKAYTLIQNRIFHPWEGGEGKVAGQYLTSLIEIAKKSITEGEYQEAIANLMQAQSYPDNLGEGKLDGVQENDVFYWLGVAWEKNGNTEEAEMWWKKASEGLDEPAAAIFYNDQQPDKIFYQGLALLKLNDPDGANTRFKKLVAYGREHRDDHVTIDYFAVSLPDLQIWEDDLDRRNRIHCSYMQGLGYLGLGKNNEAESLFTEVLEEVRSHEGVTLHLNMLREQPNII